jgi:hypothetical protein
MSAAAFAKGLLDLEGELTPIMVKLLHCVWNVVEAQIAGGVGRDALKWTELAILERAQRASTLRRKTLL